MVLNATHSIKLTNEMDMKLKEQNFMCIYSGLKIDIGENASIDHIIPKNRGGNNEISNLAWADYRINSFKGDMTKDEFIPWFQYMLTQAASVQFNGMIMTSNGAVPVVPVTYEGLFRNLQPVGSFRNAYMCLHEYSNR